MDLNTTFNNATNILFKEFDSIAVDVEFTQILSGGFNFSTGQPNVTTTSVIVRGISITENAEGATTAPSNKRKLLVKSGSIVPSYYSTVKFNSENYNIVSYSDNGYVIILDLVKDR
jgi:hypothetical protein